MQQTILLSFTLTFNIFIPQVVLLYLVAIMKPPVSPLPNIFPRNSALYRNSAFSSVCDSCASVCSKAQDPIEQTYLPNLVQGWQARRFLTLMRASLFRFKQIWPFSAKAKASSASLMMGVILLGYRYLHTGCTQRWDLWKQWYSLTKKLSRHPLALSEPWT